MAKGLQIVAPPPRRPAPSASQPRADEAPALEKFSQVREGDTVQFNRRVPRSVADGFDMLAIRTRRKVPALMAEALELLQERYGKV